MVRERPGLAPAALFHLIGQSIFLRLSDVASGLPPYTEEVLVSGMDAEARLHESVTAIGLRGAVRDPEGGARRRRSQGARGDCSPPTSRAFWPSPTGARGARPSSIPRPAI